VKAAAFGYERARTVGEAIEKLARHGDAARLIAGGQSLVPALNLRMAQPGVVIDIGRVEELRGIALLGQGARRHVRIGAMTRHAEIARSDIIAEHVPLLRLAVAHVAHAAIRNRGTFGGSLAHADPAAEFPACALALGARMHIAGIDGARIVPADAFFLGLHETAIRPGEILVAVEFDAQAPGVRAGFAELARRRGDYALVGLAMQARPHGRLRCFEDASVVFFSVGAGPVAARAAAAVLCDRDLADARRIEAARRALADDLDPPSDTQASAQTRLHLAGVLLERVALGLLEAGNV
jgi:aerobic carbon-monoxide dehydrogenase medium subunit